ncbi:unnamed protein product, partial [Symbiodinium sp. CCMP2592]
DAISAGEVAAAAISACGEATGGSGATDEAYAVAAVGRACGIDAEGGRVATCACKAIAGKGDCQEIAAISACDLEITRLQLSSRAAMAISGSATAAREAGAISACEAADARNGGGGGAISASESAACNSEGTNFVRHELAARADDCCDFDLDEF